MGFNITLTEVGVKTCALRLAYLKSIRAIFKIVELIVAIVLITIVVCYYNEGYKVPGDLFFLLVIVNFGICSFCLFISEWIVWSNVDSSSKSMFEIVFFIISFILQFSSSINLLSNVFTDEESHNEIYTSYIVCSVLGFVLVGLYLIDFVLSLCLDLCQKGKVKKASEP